MTALEVYKQHEYVINVGIAKFFGSLYRAERVAKQIGMEFTDIQQQAALKVWELALKHDGKDTGFYQFAITGIWQCLADLTQRKGSLLKLPIKDARRLQRDLQFNSFDKVLDASYDFTLYDFIGSDFNLEKYVMRKIELEQRLSIVNEQEEKVLRLLLTGKTETEVGEVLNVTRKAVSQRKLRALAKIKTRTG